VCVVLCGCQNLSHLEKNTGWRCSRMWCWWRYTYLNLRGWVYREWEGIAQREEPYFGTSHQRKERTSVKHMGEKRSACRVLVGKPEEKLPLGGIRRRWENYIKVELMYDCRAWIGFIWLKTGTNDGLLWKS